jgi:hypothetical protein
LQINPSKFHFLFCTKIQLIIFKKTPKMMAKESLLKFKI